MHLKYNMQQALLFCKSEDCEDFDFNVHLFSMEQMTHFRPGSPKKWDTFEKYCTSILKLK